MGMARYVVDAVLLEGRSPREVARVHGISKSWIYELIGRFRAGGYGALEPRSHRPRSCPHETPPAVVDRIAQLGAELQAQSASEADARADRALLRLGVTRPLSAVSASPARAPVVCDPYSSKSCGSPKHGAVTEGTIGTAGR